MWVLEVERRDAREDARSRIDFHSRDVERRTTDLTSFAREESQRVSALRPALRMRAPRTHLAMQPARRPDRPRKPKTSFLL